jgi:hypothetical protein
MVRTALILTTVRGVLSHAGAPTQAHALYVLSTSANGIDVLLRRLARICPNDNGVINTD